MDEFSYTVTFLTVGCVVIGVPWYYIGRAFQRRLERQAHKQRTANAAALVEHALYELGPVSPAEAQVLLGATIRHLVVEGPVDMPALRGLLTSTRRFVHESQATGL